MVLLISTSAAALLLGLLMPKKWGVVGFLVATAVLFIAQVIWHTVTGFSGGSIEESLLLFNGSYAAFIGFNMQITYRGFALPELIMAAVFIARLRRG